MNLPQKKKNPISPKITVSPCDKKKHICTEPFFGYVRTLKHIEFRTPLETKVRLMFHITY